MNPKELYDKWGIDYIKSYIHDLNYLADHETDEEEAEFLIDLYALFVVLFPDCDPYKEE